MPCHFKVTIYFFAAIFLDIMDFITKSPGLFHISERIFFLLNYYDFLKCENVNDQWKNILRATNWFWRIPHWFWLKKYSDHKWLDHSDSKCGKTQPYHTLFQENSWIKTKWHFVFSIFICVCEFVIWKWWGIEVWKISNWTLQDIWKSWTYEKWKNYQNILIIT